MEDKLKVSGVSFSSDRKLARCEMQYHYNYEEKLQLKRKKIGLFRGELGHLLVEAHYTRPGPGWKAKFDQLWEERWNPLFDEEKEDYGMDFMDTLYELMEHYESRWSEDDSGWTVVSLEKDYEIKTKLGFPVRWKADLIVEDSRRVSTVRRIKGHELKRRILVEHKFKKSIPGSDERILQPQVHAYAFLLGKVGFPVDTILWDYIRTEPVPRPKVNKDGSLSVRQINTDQRGYLKSLKEAGIEHNTPEELEILQKKLDSLPLTLSLERVPNSVNLKMGQEFVKDWIERARRAQLTTRPLRSWGRNCKFDCDYYKLCQVDMRGDTERNLVILRDYEKKPARKEELK
jgi:hypothetical protein